MSVKKILIIGAVIFVVSVLGWFVSVIFSVVTLGTKFRLIANIFGYTALWSVPITLILALISRKK